MLQSLGQSKSCLELDRVKIRQVVYGSKNRGRTSCTDADEDGNQFDRHCCLGHHGLFPNCRAPYIADTKIKIMEKDLEENTEFRIKWPRGEMGSLPADSEQYMMLEDLYKTTDKINKHIESMMNNRINIEFLQGQMTKVLEDIEELKDKNRDMYYNGNGSHSKTSN